MNQIKKIFDEIKIRNLPKISTLVSVIWLRYTQKITPHEYFLYEMYDLNKKGKKGINTTYSNKMIWKKYNTQSAINKVKDKNSFMKIFNDFTRRKYIDINESTASQIEDFLAKNRSEERRVGKECRSRWWTDH